MARYVTSQPLQGSMYHALQAKIAQNYSGLGPQNVSTNPYKAMTGSSFQKPLSGSTTRTSVLGAGNPHR